MKILGFQPFNPLAVPSFAKRAFSFVGYPSSVDLSHMTLVEEMDRTLKAWVQEYGDVNPEVLPGLKIPEN